jgi:hypothetical protein
MPGTRHASTRGAFRPATAGRIPPAAAEGLCLGLDGAWCGAGRRRAGWPGRPGWASAPHCLISVGILCEIGWIKLGIDGRIEQRQITGDVGLMSPAHEGMSRRCDRALGQTGGSARIKMLNRRGRRGWKDVPGAGNEKTVTDVARTGTSVGAAVGMHGVVLGGVGRLVDRGRRHGGRPVLRLRPRDGEWPVGIVARGEGRSKRRGSNAAARTAADRRQDANSGRDARATQAAAG